jgi:fibronectin type 3 domain-containing protein
MGLSSKYTRASKVIIGLLALLVAWIGFQFGTHGHTGILRTLVKAKHFLSDTSITSFVQRTSASAPAGPQHSVSLSWKPSSSAVVGYNVYRRGASGLVKLNVEPVAGTSYVDHTVQPGQTYFYVTKAVNAKGGESTASNEVQVEIPSK